MEAGHETTLTALMAALAGANAIYGLGMLDMGIIFDYAKLVLDNEIATMIKKVVRGIDVNDETMALDVIREVGSSGEFVSHQHTFERFRKEQSAPKIFNRQSYELWQAAGSKSSADKGYEIAKHILATHKPTPLPADAQKTIRNLMNEAEEHYNLPLSNE